MCFSHPYSLYCCSTFWLSFAMPSSLRKRKDGVSYIICILVRFQQWWISSHLPTFFICTSKLNLRMAVVGICVSWAYVCGSMSHAVRMHISSSSLMSCGGWDPSWRSADLFHSLHLKCKPIYFLKNEFSQMTQTMYFSII